MAHNGMQPMETRKTERPAPPPIVGIRLKKTTAEVIRSAQPAQGGGRRSEITRISPASIKNAVEVLANAAPELNSMLVCTYPETFPDDGRIVKCHHKRLLQAIERKFGDFSYFTAIEYQQRGAPHFHVGLSFDLGQMGRGPVVKKLRHKAGRRKPAFETVPNLQNWAFKTWKSIISEPDPVHYGEKLDWVGLDSDDLAQMDRAYHEYNAGFSWEVMRERNGATRYFVKELTGLKSYQKQIPANFQNPGRHFLYSDDMRFDERQAIEFIASDAEIRELLARGGWKYIPADGKPLFRRLWNAAEILAIELVKAGARPVTQGLEALRQFWDLRMQMFADKSSELWRDIAWTADMQHWVEAMEHWARLKRKLSYESYWDGVLASGPP